MIININIILAYNFNFTQRAMEHAMLGVSFNELSQE